MVPVMQHPAVAPRVRAISRDNARAWLGGAAPARPIHPPAIGRLAEIRAPTLVLIGGRDIADLRRIATLLDRGIPHSRQVVIPEAGHIINMEAQAKFNRIVAAFLRVAP
jgi:pimeloyl-ACP methyl ester carboxylesterase